jgi:hypothetical protein
MRERVNGVLGGPIVKERKTPIPSAKISTNCRIQTEASPTYSGAKELAQQE